MLNVPLFIVMSLSLCLWDLSLERVLRGVRFAAQSSVWASGLFAYIRGQENVGHKISTTACVVQEPVKYLKTYKTM